MASDALSELIKTVKVGEDGDVAYARLYAGQVKPCDFRRWFAAVQRNGTTSETDERTISAIKDYLELGMSVDEAFLDFVPDYVGPGVFSVAYDREVKSRKVALQSRPVATVPVMVPVPVRVPVPVPPFVPAFVPATVPVAEDADEEECEDEDAAE